MSSQSADSTEYDRLMQGNLARVFNERDALKRIGAINELYAKNAVLYEPPSTMATGHAAISEAVNRLLASLPPDFAFAATGPALGHHGMGRLHWRAGPPGGPTAFLGMDIAQLRDGRIQTLHVFIETTA